MAYELMGFLLSFGRPPEGLGELKLANLPRVGEWVEISDEFGKGTMYEVLMIAHSTAGGSADVFLKRIADRRASLDLLARSGGAGLSE